MAQAAPLPTLEQLLETHDPDPAQACRSPALRVGGKWSHGPGPSMVSRTPANLSQHRVTGAEVPSNLHLVVGVMPDDQGETMIIAIMAIPLLPLCDTSLAITVSTGG